MGWDRTPFARATHKIVNVEYDGSGNAIYAGWAAPGSVNSDPAWLIANMTYDASGNLLTLRFAGGDLGYDAIWNDRASLTYS